MFTFQSGYIQNNHRARTGINQRNNTRRERYNEEASYRSALVHSVEPSESAIYDKSGEYADG